MARERFAHALMEATSLKVCKSRGSELGDLALFCHVCDASQKQTSPKSLPKMPIVSIALLMIGLIVGFGVGSALYAAFQRPATKAASTEQIAFRLDDVSDAYRDSIMPFLRFALDRNMKVTLATIAGDISNQDLVNLIEAGVRKGILEVAIHGWHHEDLTIPGTDVTGIIQMSMNRLQSLFPGASISTLITPYEAVSDNILNAAHIMGLTYVSGDLDYGEPFDCSDGVKYRPATVGTAWIDYPAGAWHEFDLPSIKADIAFSFQAYGHAMVLFHPQQFQTTGSFDQTKFDLVRDLVIWAQTRMMTMRIDELSTVNLGPKELRVNLLANSALRAIILAKKVANFHTQTNQSVWELAKAEDEFNKGIQYQAFGQHDEAIAHYRSAAKHADMSMQLLRL